MESFVDPKGKEKFAVGRIHRILINSYTFKRQTPDFPNTKKERKH